MEDLTQIHPQLRPIVNKIPKLNFNRFSLKIYRQVIKFFPRQKIPADVIVKNIFIDQQNPKEKIKLRVYRPVNQTSQVPALVWMHGGGLVFGDPVLNDGILIQFVQALGIVIVSVEYRLAPENPFPLPLEDCYSALKWTHDQADELSIDKKRISIGGESAGGGLAAALAQMAVDRGEFIPKFQMLIYPMLDDTSAIDKKFNGRNFIGWTQKNNYFGWNAYLGQAPGSENIPAYAVPSKRKDLSGLPPAWIYCGDQDLFYDEDKQYFERLVEAGVACEFDSAQGVFHGFDSMYFNNPFVIDFRKKQIDALKRNIF